MLKMYTLPLGDYQTNCYILHEESSASCCIIDPGFTPQVVLSKVESLGLTVEAVLLTHGHFDHVGGVKEIAADTGCKVYIHPDELSMPPMMTGGSLYYTHTYTDGTVLNLAGLTISVRHTPGHTPGSVCLIVDNVMFSGDTLFAGSCGRTDLPGGSWPTITNSLHLLASMQTNYRVFPGHGESTTLAEEKQYNPYMR